MTAESKKMMLPEDALNRPQKPGAPFIGMDISIHNYEIPRYGFTIGDIGLLVSSDTLCEVVKVFKVYPIPNTRSWMHGLVNVRGNLVPVFDLPILFGLSDHPLSHDNLLIVDNGPESAGILISSLPRPCDTRNWNRLSEFPKLPEILLQHATEAYINNNITWIGFNHKDFFMSLQSIISH